MDIDKLILDFFKENKFYILGYIICLLSYPITSVVLPIYYSAILQNLKEDKSVELTIPISLLIFTNILYIIMGRLNTIFIPKLQSYLRINIVKVVLENNKDNFKEQNVGDLISKIVKFPIVVRDLVSQLRNNIAPVIFNSSFVTIRLFYIKSDLGFLMCTWFLISYCILYEDLKKCIRTSAELNNNTDVIHEDISELLENMMDIYSSNMIDKELDNMQEKGDKFSDRYKDIFICVDIFKTKASTLMMAMYLSTNFYGYYLYKKRDITQESLTSMIMSLTYFIGTISGFLKEFTDMILNMGVYRTTSDFFNKLSHPSTQESFQLRKGDIVFENVSISYSNKKTVKDLNLTIKSGESVSIVGKIGSGKSSLIKALLQFIPYEGNIYIDGKNVKDIDLLSLRSQILYINQHPVSFNRSIYENIIYGNENVTKRDVLDLIDKYDMHDFFDQGIDRLAGKKGSNISGGQKLMIFLLRIMLQNDKKIIILDEPTSALDEKTSKKILDMIQKISNRTTVIIVTHDYLVNKVVDRVINMSEL